MSAVGCHVARIALIPISGITGQTFDKNAPTTSIKDVLYSSTEPRIIIDPAIPNSANNPTIQNYILLEAISGYVVSHIDQTMIISYDNSALS